MFKKKINHMKHLANFETYNENVFTDFIDKIKMKKIIKDKVNNMSEEEKVELAEGLKKYQGKSFEQIKNEFKNKIKENWNEGDWTIKIQKLLAPIFGVGAVYMFIISTIHTYEEWIDGSLFKSTLGTPNYIPELIAYLVAFTAVAAIFVIRANMKLDLQDYELEKKYKK